MNRGTVGRAVRLWLLALFACGAAGAAEVPTDRPLTVDECVRIALERSPSVGVARAQVQSAEGQRMSSWAGVLPRISAGAATGRNQNNRGLRRDVEYTRQVGDSTYVQIVPLVPIPSYSTTSYSYDVTASANVLDWSAWRRISASGSAVAGAEAGEEAAREGVAYAVKRQYYEYLRAIKLAQVARDAEDLSRKQHERTQALFDLGSVTRGDVLSARVTVAQDELARISAENRVAVERARLAKEMGISVSSPLEIVEEFGPPEAGVDESAAGRALSLRGDVRQERYQLEGARASLSAARAGYLPSLGVQWGYQWNDNERPDLFGSFDYNTRWSVYLSLDVPIFDGLQTRGSVTQSKAAVRSRERTLRGTELQAALEIEESRLAIDQAEKQVASATEGVALAEENHRLRQQMYEVGAATLLEVQAAQVDLTRARLAHRGSGRAPAGRGAVRKGHGRRRVRRGAERAGPADRRLAGPRSHGLYWPRLHWEVSMSRRRRNILLGSAAVLVLALVVVANLRRSAEKRTEVRVEEAKRRSLTQVVRATGKVKSATEVNLSATLMGQVSELAVREGEKVEKDQFLLRLDDTQFLENLRQAEAALAAARAAARLADAECERATQAVQRKRALHERGLASDEDRELAETSIAIAQATCDARERDVARFEAEVRAARDNLAKTAFHAPIAGVIARLNIEQGENVITGTMNNPGTVILTIADLSAMEVVADVDETDVVRVEVGQPAKIRVDALPDTAFPGTITEVASAGRRTGAGVDEATDFEVTIRFEQNVPQVRTEMTADVEITTAKRDSVLSVPIPAVVARERKDLEPVTPGKGRKKETEEPPREERDGAETRRVREDLVTGVFTFKDGKALFVPVRTGISDDRYFELVSAALEPGEKVIVGPYKSLRNLKPGKAVKTVKKTSEKTSE